MQQKNVCMSQPLVVELQHLERQGITIWLDGNPDTSSEVIDFMSVKESPRYGKAALSRMKTGNRKRTVTN